MGYQSATRLASLLCARQPPAVRAALPGRQLGPGDISDLPYTVQRVTSLGDDFPVAVPFRMVADDHIWARVRRREPGASR